MVAKSCPFSWFFKPMGCRNHPSTGDNRISQVISHPMDPLMMDPQMDQVAGCAKKYGPPKKSPKLFGFENMGPHSLGLGPHTHFEHGHDWLVLADEIRSRSMTGLAIPWLSEIPSEICPERCLNRPMTGAFHDWGDLQNRWYLEGNILLKVDDD